MHKHPRLLWLAFAAALVVGPGGSGMSRAGALADEAEPIVREIYVPFEDLNVLLEDQPQRVLLSREEYESLLKKAKVVPETRAPRAAIVVSANYVMTAEAERAQLTGTLIVEVLEQGLHAVELDLSGVGLRRATLDGRSAAIGRAETGPLTLFVEGQGRHELVLEMVAPLETTAATQVLNVRLPRPPAATLRLTVPGDVEVKSGADVARRVVDEAADVTRFELLPKQGDMTLIMTLNSRLARRKRVVMARSVLVDEVTEAYERLHATVSMKVLHQAVEDFRFVVPEGFEITEVGSPLLARWAIEEQNGKRVLQVRLREQTTETVVLSLSAVRTSAFSDAWTLPKLEPLDVVGQVAVVGLLVDRRLDAESVAAEGLIPIDTAVLREAIPETVLKAEPGAPTLRSVVAYYAPQSEFALSARFVKPPPELSVMTNVLLLLREQDQQARGEFFLSPKVEKLFGFDFSVPPAWDVTSITTPDGSPLAFERYVPENDAPQDAPGRIHVRLPQGVPPGEECRVYVNAQSAPTDWLGTWDSTQVEFPVFAAAGAASDVGAIAVEAPDGEMEIRLHAFQNLVPLDAAERQQYGLEESETTGRVLAYRYDAQPYQATLLVTRTKPRLTAKTFSFLRTETDALAAHCEIIYQVDEARTRQLSLLLPQQTPADLSIEALDGVRLKQFTSSETDGMRRWAALLEEPQRGSIRLAVDFRQPFPEQEQLAPEQEVSGFLLPIVRADGVAYQSGLVAVEGNPELEVQVSTDARRVDVGELAEARRQPGRGLLGVFGFVGEPPEVKVDVFRRPGHRLYPTIVERAELSTRLSATGESMTVARFDLRTKAVYLEVELPPKAQLWAADLDQKPLKPQREGDHLLVSVPAASGERPRALRIVYQMPAHAVGLSGEVAVPAPTLRLRAERETESAEVRTANLVWHLHAPPGYEVIRSDGTVTADVERPELAILTVAKAVCVPVFWHVRGFPMPGGCGAMRAREASQTVPSPYYLSDDAQYLAQRPAVRFADESAPADAEPEGEEAPEEAPEAEVAGMELEALRSGAEAAKREGRAAGVLFDVDAFAAPAQEGMAQQRPPGAQEPSAQPQVPVPQPMPPPEVPPSARRLFEGFRSLKIDLEEAPDGDGVVTFQSLGVEPRLVVRLANRPRFDSLAWGVALAVALLGVALTNRRARAKFRFLLLVILVGSLVPLVPSWEETAGPANAAVLAACLLVPYYLLAGCVKWFVGLFQRSPRPSARSAVAATTAILVGFQMAMTPGAGAAEPQAKSAPYVVQVIEPPEPVKVPEDAIILPYDPESETGIRDADQMLVPYAKYVELWNLAYPDQKIQVEAPPAAYALAGASYTTRLEGDEYLLVDGRLEIDVYTEEPAMIPLGLAGGVFARAELDGKPARLSVPQVIPPNVQPQGQPPPHPAAEQPAPQPAPQPAQQRPQQQAAEPPVQSGSGATRPMVVLHVSGKGRHRLDLAVRLRLERRGGWRVAEGVLPSAPAGSLAITVPQAQTDVRLGQVLDRQSYETEQADQTIDTALGPGGALSIRWRPQVAEGQVDRSLTARSSAVLDVQEDGLRLVWQLALEFRRSQREAFSVQVPGDYLVERVEGTNVRGWEVRQEEQHQTIEISLLKAARDSEGFAIHLWRRGPVGQGDLAQFDAPLVTVPDAALHNGRLTVRRSPLLDLRTQSTSGVTRTDLSGEASEAAGALGGVGSEESPLGIRPYEAYEFAATPFSVRLAAGPLVDLPTAEVQTVLKIAEFERSLESQVILRVQDRPIYRVEIVLPDELDLEDVSAPGDFQWVLTRRDNRPLLTVYLAAGQQGETLLRIAGKLARRGATDPLLLPRLEVLGAQRQEGDVAVQVDPAFDVEAVDLEHCEKVLRSQIYDWLNPVHRDVTRLALHYQQPDYQGTLRLSLRQPDVSCETITNVRITDRAIEETLLVNFTIQQAGIRDVEFLVPYWMRDCRVQVPMLRQKTVEPAEDREQSPLRVHLQLQDDVMGELRVLVENDRELTREAHLAPIPVVQTGSTLRQAVALQTAGRDEVVVDKSQLVGLKPLRREESAWGELRQVLGGITEAYLVTAGAESPRLVFQTKERKALETAGARIGLAEANLVFDRTGAYRAEQTYRLDNTTEQFLVIELPETAELWTAVVAGQPVKPTQVPGALSSTTSRRVRIPLVKTAPGDLDYAVVLKYGGKMPPRGTLDAVQTPVGFPLVETVNIRVELSQVRLYLPEQYRWFDFGGTMGLVGEEEDLTAGLVSYQTKVAERLMETMQQDSRHAKRRAANNLKQLGLAVQRYEAGGEAFSAFRYNVQLGEEYARNAAVMQKAEQQLQQLEEEVRGGYEQTFDNRARLNALFEDQKTARAKNVVQDLGPNWDRPVDEQLPQGAPPPSKFNRDWLIGNQLLTGAADEKLKDADRLAPPDTTEFRLEAGKKALVPAQQRFRGTRFQEGKAGAAGKPRDAQGEERAGQEGRPEGMPSDSFGYERGQPVDRRSVNEAEFLRGRRRYGATVTDGSAASMAVEALGEQAGVQIDRQAGFAFGDALDTGAVQAPAGPAAEAALPAGLASLDVQLPMRGVVYRFSTPGGDVEITARAVPSKLVDGLGRAAVILGAVLAVLLLVRLARRGGFGWLVSRAGSWCLLLTGLMLFCVFPVLGLVAMVSGIVIKVWRISSRQASPAALGGS